MDSTTFNPLLFPLSTIVDKPVPKAAFYKRAKPQRITALKTFLTDDFDSIRWLYKLHPAALNIACGQQVSEIDVFFCKMKTTNYDVSLLCEIDALIPRHTFYILDGKDRFQLWLQPKSCNAQGVIVPANRVERLTCARIGDTPIALKGHNMDQLYGDLLGTISSLNTQTEAEYYEAAERRQQLKQLETQCAALQKRIRKEKQFPLQVELNQALRQLQAQIAHMKEQVSSNKNNIR